MATKSSLPQAAEEFLITLIGRSPATKKLYRRVLTHLFEFAEKDINTLEVGDLQGYLQHLEEDHVYKKNTLRANSNILRSFFRFLKRDDLREYIKPIRPAKTLPLVPKPAEIEAMINCTKDLRNRIIIQILARTGIRLGELTYLSIEDIDLPNLRIVIRGRGEWIPKGGKERIARMDPKTASLVKKYIGSRREGRLLDVTPGTIRTIVKRIAKKAGIRNAEKMTPHKFRHFYAVDLLQRGIDVRSLQKLLGHSDLSTTCTYLDYSFDTVSLAYDKAIKKEMRT